MTDKHEGKTGKSSMDKFRLLGKVALVTGGSRGIGRNIATGLAEAGADVALVARNLPDLEEVAQDITKMGRKALTVTANIRHIDELDGLVKKTLDEFNTIDILVNNAGTNPVFGSVFDIDEKAWDITIGLNLKGTFFLSQAVGRVMREKGGGSIINIASDEGIRPFVGLGVYSISKAGVIMLSKVLAEEWGQYNIRVNTIAPSWVRTRFSQAIWGNPLMLKEIENATALGRIAEPEEITNAAIFLASEASSYVTGQTITLDGGHFASVQTMLSLMAKKE